MPKLHWKRTQPGLHGQWETEEQLDGIPDFLIVRQGLVFRMKQRTSAQWMIFESLADAKNYAEAI